MKNGKEVWSKLSDAEFFYHKKQYEIPYRSTVFSIEFLKKCAGFREDSKLTVLDLGTGGGANLYWLSRHFPSCKFYGIDSNADLISLAEENNRSSPNVKFICGDFEHAKTLGKYDYVVSFQVLSWLSFKDAYKLLKLKFTLANKGVFATSLFCEDNLEYEVKVMDYHIDKMVFYNIYSLQRFRELSQQEGFELKHCQKFDLDIDLPKVEGKGTYTLKTETGQRLQFSGCMYLPWYFLLFQRSNV